LGTRRGLEAEVVSKAGFPIDYIQVAGLRGTGLTSLLTAPVKLLSALYQGLKIMRRRNPAAVLGMGGYVTGPGGLAAWLSRRPLLIHEQNARAGLTNRLLMPLAKRVMEAFPNTFRADARVRHTGNPLRRAFVEKAALKKADSRDYSHTINKPLRLLVVGGSLGAAHLNSVVPAALAGLDTDARPEVWHQTGKQNFEVTQAAYKAAEVMSDAINLAPFIDDMAAAYAWADVVLCRAGAMTIAELAAAAVPSILVPFPYAVDDHQTANAKYLADQQAAILVQQIQLSAQHLCEVLTSLTPARLEGMSKAAAKLALLDATTQVVEQCLDVAQARNKGGANG
jgi:UDP-N-acetylglucosamine--N-acetylmuramyl-(pentapeptide) pyrophosphoryl-undecaprenol N-acetylglucosamine transferase